MGEFLSNIKFLKFYAWEEPMSDIIKGTRYLEKVRVLDLIILTVVANGPFHMLTWSKCWLFLLHSFFHRTFFPK